VKHWEWADFGEEADLSGKKNLKPGDKWFQERQLVRFCYGGEVTGDSFTLLLA